MNEHTVEATAPAVRRPISRRRRRAFIIVILIAIAAGQELLFRALFPVPEVANFNRLNYTYLHIMGSDLEATRRQGLSNTIIRWESEPDGFTFDHTLNLYGFRGPTFRIAPRPDRPRILFVGDSFVESCGAADDATLTEQFARVVTRRPAEAVNLGVAAADLRQYAQLIADGLALLEPAAVYLVVCPNDLINPSDDLLLAPLEFRPVNRWLPRGLQVCRNYAAGASVPLRFPSGPHPFFAPVPAPNNPLSASPAPDGIDPRILEAMRQGRANYFNAGSGELFRRLLRFDYSTGRSAQPVLTSIASRCRLRGVPLVVVYVPHRSAVNPDYIAQENRLGGPAAGPGLNMLGPPYRNQQAHLRSVCDRLATPFLDTTEAFIRAEKSRRLFWPIDGHCNAEGYRLLAELCAGYWIDGTLPSE